MRNLLLSLTALAGLTMASMPAHADMGDTHEMTIGRYGAPIYVAQNGQEIFATKGCLVGEYYRNGIVEGVTYSKQTPFSQEEIRDFAAVNLAGRNVGNFSEDQHVIIPGGLKVRNVMAAWTASHQYYFEMGEQQIGNGTWVNYMTFETASIYLDRHQQ
jgi:hypothetical protein